MRTYHSVPVTIEDDSDILENKFLLLLFASHNIKLDIKSTIPVNYSSVKIHKLIDKIRREYAKLKTAAGSVEATDCFSVQYEMHEFIMKENKKKG